MYNDFITLEYYLNINNKIVIDSASERISIKYCPMCGRKLGK
jgi:FKBP-type peptidyl-prolyl cis-trans isomerase 2